jgi:serine/threonine protein kinase
VRVEGDAARRMSSDQQFPAGTRVGKYELIRPLGHGSMGAVYEAVHTALSKRVAIKTLLPHLAAIPEARVRFLREGKASARIQHPNVVRVTDVDGHEGVPFLVMEYLEGETLGDLFARQGALSLQGLLEVMLPVLSAVNAGHEAGVIHRDLKPHNIFLTLDARGDIAPKVLDFGISKLLGDSKDFTASGATLGTLAYMSPEQAENAKKADARSDQYSVALIIYEGATGRRAFEGDQAFAVLSQIVAGSIPPPRAVRPELPEEFERSLMRALALRPERRYPSVHDLALALVPFASSRARMLFEGQFGATSSVATAPLPVPASRPRAPSRNLPPAAPSARRVVSPLRFLRGWRLGAALALAVGAVVAVVLSVVISYGDPDPDPPELDEAPLGP